MTKRPAFRFETVASSFKDLLLHSWTRNAALGSRHISDNMSPFEKNFAYGYAAKQLGYVFGFDTYPDKSGPISYLQQQNMVTTSFTRVCDTVANNPDTLEPAARSLAIHAFLQQQYNDTGAMQKWKHWGVGYNDQKFMIYKDVANPHEREFLLFTHNLIEQEDRKHSAPSTSLYETYSEEFSFQRLVLKNKNNVPDLLNHLQDKIFAGLDISVHAAKGDPELKRRLETIYKA